MPRVGLRPYKKAGNGDLIKGLEDESDAYFEARKLVAHPVACIDCHDPSTMQLRVTAPVLSKACAPSKPHKACRTTMSQATRQEMRAYVCGQCHVEYYFKGPEKRLVYPWAKGLKSKKRSGILRRGAFKDWTHARNGCPHAQSATSGVRDVESRSPRVRA